MNCKNCKYFQDINGWGYCKFNAPVIRKEQRKKQYWSVPEPDEKLIEEVCHTEWAKTSDDDWCGQFVKKLND